MKIHFIVNPIAGSSKHNITSDFLKQHFEDEKYELTVKHSNFKKHAITLAQESISEGAEVIVACGGDGTINEVASCLANTPVILGIIPTGSGNGLASNLNIPKNPIKAIQLIKTNDVKKIDAGSINNELFFSNTGIGFDAKVIKYYEASQRRRLSSYFRACVKVLKESNSNESAVNININGENLSTKPFMVFISNSNELGYNVSLTPKASLQDGLLDVLVVSHINTFQALFLGVLVLIKKHHLMKQVKSFKTKNVKLSITDSEHFNAQIDGEFYKMNSNTITISIIENALHVIA